VSGKGKVSYFSGDVYKGDIVGGKPDGEGKMEYKGGNVHEGGWKGGLKHGEGKVGKVVMRGYWKDGELQTSGETGGKLDVMNSFINRDAVHVGLTLGWTMLVAVLFHHLGKKARE